MTLGGQGRLGSVLCGMMRSMGGPVSTLLGAYASAVRAVRGAAREVPVIRSIEAGVSEVERFWLGELRRLLDDASANGAPVTPPPPAGEPSEAPTLAERMQALLSRSMDDTPAQSRSLLHEALLAELVPDEARILSALADGSTYPLVHVAEPGLGSFQKRVLENASNVGRRAGVALPERTHLYVTHLRRLGLVATADEDSALREEYDILLTERVVQDTVAALTKGPRNARIIRRTLRISDLGRELWAATRR